ncbi:hypothetical protein [Demequina silvatica]|uniref:hypothetical protein n=1 Tax=Demequina silvatica TaxID=1638988 RepID=UPI001E2E3AEC|nr:hypothetical protein [Demequina silvatica]
MHRLPFFPVTLPAIPDRPAEPADPTGRTDPTDHVDTDEIPEVDAAHPFGEDDDADPVVTAGADAADLPDPAEGPGDGDEPVIEHRPRSAGLVVTVAMLTVLLLAASALIAYLWRVSDAWEARALAITEANYEIGSQLAQERDTLTVTQDQLDLVSQQLSTSKDTVTRLQAENAQWGDDAAYAQEEIAALQSIITDASAVANSLTRCVEGHEQLAEYLSNPDDIKPKELRTFQESVDELCQAAADSNLAFQQSVAQ